MERPGLVDIKSKPLVVHRVCVAVNFQGQGIAKK